MRINQERLVAEFLELVQIDSFAGRERQIADTLIPKLSELGFDVHEDDAGATIQGNTGNLIAKLAGDSQKPTLLFSAHMDRVAPGDGIKPVIDGGIIKSDGTTILAADDVAGIVAILEGLRTAKEQKITHGNIEVVFTIAEEGGLHGAKALKKADLDADFGYFLDSDGAVGSIVNQAPAHQNIKFTFHGKAAHAGVEPEKGLNAIKIAAEAIAQMNIGRIDHETTANVGIIQGGSATNIVAEQCVVKCEVRSLDGSKLKAQIEHMLDAAKASANKAQAKLDIEIDDSYSAFKIAESEPVVSLAIKAAESIGLTPQVHGTGGGSDASVVNGLGIPSVVLGVNFKNVHSKSEMIAVEDLAKAAEYTLALIENA